MNLFRPFVRLFSPYKQETVVGRSGNEPVHARQFIRFEDIVDDALCKLRAHFNDVEVVGSGTSGPNGELQYRTVKADDWFFAVTREGRDFGFEVKSPLRPEWIQAVVLVGRIIEAKENAGKRYYENYIPSCIRSILSSWREFTQFFERDDCTERLAQLTAETRTRVAARGRIPVESLPWDDDVYLSTPSERFKIGRDLSKGG